MRRWFSLATVLVLLLCLCDGERFSYEECPEGNVCIFFDDNACGLNEVDYKGVAKRYGGFIWSVSTKCAETFYGPNFVGLNIRPFPPYFWNIGLTVADNEAWLRSISFDFGGFTISFSSMEKAKITWHRQAAVPSISSMVRISFGSDSEISNTQTKFVRYSFTIDSGEEKLIDLIGRGVVTYSYTIPGTPRPQSTKLERSTFVDQLDLLNDCDIDKYFDATECPAEFACQKLKNDPIFKACDLGTPEVFTWGFWMKVIKLSCGDAKSNQWLYDENENSKGNSVNLQHARCLINEPCELDLAASQQNCLFPVECVPLISSGHSLSCPTGYDLEVDFNGRWNYLAEARCYKIKIFWKNGNGKYTETVTDARCRKKRNCVVSEYFDASLSCENTKLCHMPSNTFACRDGFQPQYTLESGKKWANCDKLSCQDDQLRLTMNNVMNNLIPLHVRCMKKKKCELTDYSPPKSNCEADNECAQPTLSGASNAVTCPREFGLQVNFDSALNAASWRDTAIICAGDDLFVDGAPLDKYPFGIRCVHKNIGKFYDDSDCESYEICTKPINCDSMKCSDHLGKLQMKSTASNNWIDVESARCNSDKFFVKNGEEISHQTAKFRCIRLKCTSCEDPCPDCVIDSVLRESSKWDECVEFSCGVNTRVIFTELTGDRKKEISFDARFECSKDANDATLWKINGSSEAKRLEILCEKICSPATTVCPPKDTHCKAPDSFNPNRLLCGNKMFVKFKDNAPVEINTLLCNTHNGTWVAEKRESNEQMTVSTDSNVYCHEGNCEISRIFPSCEDDNKECRDYEFDGNKYFCKEPATFWYRERTEESWRQLDDIYELECLAGSIVANGTTKDYDFQANCKVPEAPSSEYQSKLGVYLAVASFVLILTVIIIAIIIFQVTSKEWLHVIIIDKIRGKKRKKAARGTVSTPKTKKGNRNSPSKKIRTASSKTSTRRKTRKPTSASSVGRSAAPTEDTTRKVNADTK